MTLPEPATHGSFAPKTTLVHLLILCVVTSVVYSNTLSNPYHLDSIDAIKNNTRLEQFWPPWRHFFDPQTSSVISPSQWMVYRPVRPLSHTIDIAVYEGLGIDRLTGFHLTNIAIHIATVILIYFLFRRLLIRYSRLDLPVVRLTQIAFLSSLLFAVHPISGVPVNYLMAREILLMLFFLTAGFHLYVRMRTQGESLLSWLAVLALFLLSIMSKENGVFAVALVFLAEVILFRAPLKDWRTWARTATVAAVPAAHLLVRSRFDFGDGAVSGMSWVHYGLTQLKLHLFYYLRNFLWPFELRTLASEETVTSFTDPYMLAAGVFVLASLGLAWYLRLTNPVATYSILVYWTLLLLTSSVLPLYLIISDYRQYPSLAFLCLFVVTFLFHYFHDRPAFWATAVLGIYLSVSSYSMNNVWRTAETLWKQSVKYGTTATGHTNYGLSVLHKDPKLAEHHYREAIRLYPYHVFANINLGLLLISQEQVDEGISIVKRVVARSPTWPLTHYWLFQALSRANREPEEAVREIVLAADLDPRRILYQYLAARALQTAGRTEESLVYLNRLESLEPDHKDAQFLVGWAHQKAGRHEIAVDSYRRFLQTHSQHAQARLNMAIALRSIGNCEEAIRELDKLLELFPQNTAIRAYLAACQNTVRGSEAGPLSIREQFRLE